MVFCILFSAILETIEDEVLLRVSTEAFRPYVVQELGIQIPEFIFALHHTVLRTKQPAFLHLLPAPTYTTGALVTTENAIHDYVLTLSMDV